MVKEEKMFFLVKLSIKYHGSFSSIIGFFGSFVIPFAIYFFTYSFIAT